MVGDSHLLPVVAVVIAAVRAVLGGDVDHLGPVGMDGDRADLGCVRQPFCYRLPVSLPERTPIQTASDDQLDAHMLFHPFDARAGITGQTGEDVRVAVIRCHSLFLLI